MQKALVERERGERARRGVELVVDGDAERHRLRAELALALLELRLAVGAQHQREVRLPRKARLHAQDDLHQVAEYVVLGAAHEG